MWKIIGIGSPHGDDRFGWSVIDSLQQRSLPVDVQLLSLDRPGPALLNHLQPDYRTILIDAADVGLPVGQLCWIDSGLLSGNLIDNRSSHAVGVQQSLQLAEALGIRLPPIQALVCQLAQTEPMAALSLEVSKAVKRACDELCNRLMFQDARVGAGFSRDERIDGV